MIRIMKYGEEPNSAIFQRSTAAADVSGAVAEIIEAVRKEGDEALRRFEEKFDHVKLDKLEVTASEMEAAMARVTPEFLGVLERSAANIRSYHAKQQRPGYIMTQQPGLIVGQRVIPLERVGICVPGSGSGTPLASTVLMNAIPASLAGCGEICMVTPAQPDGTISPAILAAAKISGVDRVFKLGGAQAVAALACGTETVPRVDKIVGPGGAFVAEAKKQVFGQVAIDMIAGPSEILVVSDGKSDPRYLAADMLSQAEHDKNAAAVLVTDSMDLARAVQQEIEAQLPKLARQEIARASVEANGKIIVAEDLKTAIAVANEIAPEHLELCLDDPFDYLDDIRHAGSVFLGRSCPEAMGDYCAGPNHTLPTGGTARFSSPLSVDDFVKKSQYIYYTREAQAAAAPDVALFAEVEGLTGHARSALIRREDLP
ncbi:MAG: histidinol dehydrogenase [Oscillospiraceae bacterium]|nr:histidinol dehydrogenase [Oscillospiraceae bacterium]